MRKILLCHLDSGTAWWVPNETVAKNEIVRSMGEVIMVQENDDSYVIHAQRANTFEAQLKEHLL